MPQLRGANSSEIKGALLFFIYPDYFGLSKGGVLTYSDSRQVDVFNLCDLIKEERLTKLSLNEDHHLFRVVENTQKISGDIAEVGYFQGGSSKSI
ncbi:hypothetical protein DID80_03305 [Candidatus Marinamargulisbacteria bacterium SCGC AAA071-K20]|nr:hypothetical protein DID80_03305 [Candidatus Marinamargulisbacteria bacterium SCGC AAA071-K20]